MESLEGSRQYLTLTRLAQVHSILERGMCGYDFALCLRKDVAYAKAYVYQVERRHAGAKSGHSRMAYLGPGLQVVRLEAQRESLVYLVLLKALLQNQLLLAVQGVQKVTRGANGVEMEWKEVIQALALV